MNAFDHWKRVGPVGLGALALVVGLGVWIGMFLLLIGLAAWAAGGPSAGPTYSAPAYNAPYSDVAPGASGNDTYSSEPYNGLSEDEKQAIWAQELPTWTQEERKHAIEGTEP